MLRRDRTSQPKVPPCRSHDGVTTERDYLAKDQVLLKRIAQGSRSQYFEAVHSVLSPSVGASGDRHNLNSLTPLDPKSELCRSVSLLQESYQLWVQVSDSN